jgi:hypothetical protein
VTLLDISLGFLQHKNQPHSAQDIAAAWCENVNGNVSLNRTQKTLLAPKIEQKLRKTTDSAASSPTLS